MSTVTITSGSPNPIDNEDLYDSVILAGVASPGKVTLSGHDRKVDWDVKAGPNIEGATVTLKTVKPIEFTATFYLVKDVAQGIDDFAKWPAFLAVINSSVQGGTKALDIYHPDLASNDIKSVVKGTVGGTVHDGKGGQTIVVKFQEYKSPKAKSGTPAGSKTGAPDPNAAALAQLAALTATYQNTPWG